MPDQYPFMALDALDTIVNGSSTWLESLLRFQHYHVDRLRGWDGPQTQPGSSLIMSGILGSQPIPYTWLSVEDNLRALDAWAPGLEQGPQAELANLPGPITQWAESGAVIIYHSGTQKYFHQMAQAIGSWRRVLNRYLDAVHHSPLGPDPRGSMEGDSKGEDDSLADQDGDFYTDLRGRLGDTTDMAIHAADSFLRNGECVEEVVAVQISLLEVKFLAGAKMRELCGDEASMHDQFDQDIEADRDGPFYSDRETCSSADTETIPATNSDTGEEGNNSGHWGTCA